LDAARAVARNDSAAVRAAMNTLDPDRAGAELYMTKADLALIVGDSAAARSYVTKFLDAPQSATGVDRTAGLRRAAAMPLLPRALLLRADLAAAAGRRAEARSRTRSSALMSNADKELDPSWLGARAAVAAMRYRLWSGRPPD